MNEGFFDALGWSLVITACLAVVPSAAIVWAGLVEVCADGRGVRGAKKKRRRRVRTWRDMEPSRWRGFLFTLRKRPRLALRWAFRRWLCGPVSRAFSLVGGWLVARVRGVVDWVAEGVSPARSVVHARRAWVRVELARNFNVNQRNGGAI